MLGVALALAVHLINASALAEFSSAVSAVNGQPDLELRARQGLLDDALEHVAPRPGVAQASPVLELSTSGARPRHGHGVRLVGVDALSVAAVSPALMPRTGKQTGDEDNRTGRRWTCSRPTRCSSTRPRGWRWRRPIGRPARHPAGAARPACDRCAWPAR
jgi:hypothetical protein